MMDQTATQRTPARALLNRRVRGLWASVFLSALLLSCGGGPSHTKAPVHPSVGKRISLTLTLVDGGELVVPRRRTVLHFFATWSLASQGDVEELIALHTAREGEIDVIGVGLDPNGYQLIAPWKRASAVTYLVAESTAAMREGKSAVGSIVQVPTTLILDSSGRVLHRIERPLQPGELAKLVGGD